jgi:hypothetical protein
VPSEPWVTCERGRKKCSARKKEGGHDFGRVTDGREEDGWPMVEKKADTRHRAGWSCTREHTINVLGTFINIYIMVIVNA